jgi:hypothetical protein
MRYAQVLDGKLHWVFESSTQPEFSPEIFIIPLSAYPDAEEGWLYDKNTGQCYPPEEPGPQPEPEKSVTEIAKEIQDKQKNDILIQYDVLATVFEDLETNDLIKFEVMATMFEAIIDLEEKVQTLIDKE